MNETVQSHSSVFGKIPGLIQLWEKLMFDSFNLNEIKVSLGQ